MTGVLTQTYLEIRTFIIGKFYSPAQLAYFSRGQHTCSMPLQLATSVLGPITFPILATLQEDQQRLFQVYRKYIRLMTMCIEWGMITLAANASAFIVLLYGENWSTAAIYAQILCFGWMLNPLLSLNSNLCAILGRTDLNLKLEIVLRTVSITVMILCAFHSVTALCYAAVFAASFGFLASCIIITNISPIRIAHLATDFFPYLFMALIANMPSFFIDKLDWHPCIRMFLGVALSATLYGLFLWLRKDQTATYLISIVVERFTSKRAA